MVINDSIVGVHNPGTVVDDVKIRVDLVTIYVVAYPRSVVNSGTDNREGLVS